MAIEQLASPADVTPRPVAVGAARPQLGLVPSGIAALILIALFAAALISRAGGDSGVRAIDDLSQLAAAGLAAVSGLSAARRTDGRMRGAWLAIGLGAGAWALGQVVWCYYELLAHRETPFPSAADVGFLLFPVGAAAGLILFPSADSIRSRRRWILDGAIITSALVTVSWSTTLGAVARAGGDSALAFAVSVAYPVGDIVILSLAIISLCRPRAQLGHLVLLSAAMAAMAVADSSFAYLTATGAYHSGSLSDVGWVGAFLLLAVAGADARTQRGTPLPATPQNGVITDRALAAPATMLPYLPVLLAAVIMSVRHFDGQQLDLVEFAAFSISMALVLIRQYTTVRENRALLAVVSVREAQLHRQAFHDPLTGLANRALFINRAEHALDLHRRDLRPVAVLFCDLDDFKTVNDSMGHGAGDELLVRVADRLRGALRPGDTLARLGGDEFAVLLEDDADPAAVGARLVQSLDEVFVVADLQLTIRVSVGLTELMPEDVTPRLDDLLARADIAMYSAKRAGKGQLASYDGSMASRYVDDLALRQPLITAIRAGDIQAAYQPLVRVGTSEIVGLEALARWHHDGRDVAPAQFIPLASQTGQLEPLTYLMLDRACAQLSAWSHDLGRDDLHVSVNIPPALITDPAFPTRALAVLSRHGLVPRQLTLEITEEALLSDLDAARRMTSRLRELGMGLCLDDFGTGYSSLLHLQSIALDTLKIDRGFVADIDTNPTARRLIQGILSLATGLGLDVVAEGVERETQADVLHQLGCAFAQGYLYARPSPADQVPALFNHSRGRDRDPVHSRPVR